MKPLLHWIGLQNTPIFEQLSLEEALLRSHEENFCLVNFGSPPAIVLGTSNSLEELVDLPLLAQNPIPLFRRFSGGGTVVVDENTLFVTFILQKEALPIDPFPESILRWSAALYAKAWEIPHFSLRENDYLLFDRKCGGNAQYIRKSRYLHHTSFLWNYEKEKMRYLRLPNKRPLYRQDRSHEDFLTTLSSLGGTIASRIEQLQQELSTLFRVVPFDPKKWTPPEHRKSLRRENPSAIS